MKTTMTMNTTMTMTTTTTTATMMTASTIYSPSGTDSPSGTIYSQTEAMFRRALTYLTGTGETGAEAEAAATIEAGTGATEATTKATTEAKEAATKATKAGMTMHEGQGMFCSLPVLAHCAHAIVAGEQDEEADGGLITSASDSSFHNILVDRSIFDIDITFSDALLHSDLVKGASLWVFPRFVTRLHLINVSARPSSRPPAWTASGTIWTTTAS
jgi:hypothetical protein